MGRLAIIVPVHHLPKAPMLLISLLSCSSSKNTATSSDTPKETTPFTEVKACDDPSFNLSDEAKNALTNVGFTQCLMPFDILIGADQEIPSRYVGLTAQILAELLDPDQDGTPNDPQVLAELQLGTNAWLAMPSDSEKWDNEQVPVLQQVLGYDIIIPTWWMGNTSSSEPSKHVKAVMVEEVTHFITQFGWSPVYPEQFGVMSWDSIIAQETKSAACEWWQHPENSCPDSPQQTPGNCTHPSCDVVEFYHQVLIMRAGMEPAWLGIGFPDNAETLESLLSDELKSLMDNPQYHQPQTPLSFTYGEE